MMGRLNRDQEQLFYSFCLEEAVPDDHLVRAIAAVLDLSWVHGELGPYYSHLGRPSIDPALMIRMLIVGYVFAIRSERALCRAGAKASKPSLQMERSAIGNLKTNRSRAKLHRSPTSATKSARSRHARSGMQRRVP